MASSYNKAVYIAGSSTKGKVEIKLVAKFLLSTLSVAVENVSAATITTKLCVSSLLFGRLTKQRSDKSGTVAFCVTMLYSVAAILHHHLCNTQ